jgi:hypothetical protein
MTKKSDENLLSGIKRQREKMNITNLIKNEGKKLNSDKYIQKQFKFIILNYINKNLSFIERSNLNLTEYGKDDKSIKKKIGRMLLKPQYRKSLPFFTKFKILFNKKIRKFIKNKETQSNQQNKSTPFIIILSSSAMRCIQIQKKLSKLKLIQSKKLRWAYAFAKHKSLKEQINFFRNDNKSNPAINLIFATPHRLIQLIKADSIDLDKLKYIVIDFLFRDTKLKRFFDILDIKNQFLKLFFDVFLLYNKDKIKIKFFLA